MQTHKLDRRIQALFAISVFSIALGVFIYSQRVLGNVTQESAAGDQAGKYRNYTFFATSTTQVSFATTTTAAQAYATSTSITQWTDSNSRVDKGFFVIAGAKKVELYVARQATSTASNNGESTFKVQTTNVSSPAEADWLDFGKLILATTTNQTLQAQVNISKLAATTSVAMDLTNHAFYALRCMVRTGDPVDGEHRCSASAEW